MVKVVCEAGGGGAHLTKPGWSKPRTHSNFQPHLFGVIGHKITLYRFNQGAHAIAGGLKWEQGAEPPGPLTLTTALRSPCMSVMLVNV